MENSKEAQAINLFFECRRWNVLPYAGGFLDQPARIMGKFAVLSDEMAQHEAAEVRKAEARAKLEGERTRGRRG